MVQIQPEYDLFATLQPPCLEVGRRPKWPRSCRPTFSKPTSWPSLRASAPAKVDQGLTVAGDSGLFHFWWGNHRKTAFRCEGVWELKWFRNQVARWYGWVDGFPRGKRSHDPMMMNFTSQKPQTGLFVGWSIVPVTLWQFHVAMENHHV